MVCFVKMKIGLFAIFTCQMIQVINSATTCDAYLRKNPENEVENITIFTLVNYSFPRNRYIERTKENVSCPCFSDRPCLRKCCLQEDSFISTKKKCRNSYVLSVTEDHRFEAENLPFPIWNNFTLIYGSYCPSTVRSLEDVTFVSETGNMIIGKEILHMEEYCIDYFDDMKQFMMLQCSRFHPSVQPVNKVYTVCLMCSICFLLITFSIYACISSLRSLQGKLLLCYVLNMLIRNGFLVTLHVTETYEGNLCIVSGKFVIFK